MVVHHLPVTFQCAALLAVRLRPLRWVAMGIALILAGLTFLDLVHYHDIVVTMRRFVDRNSVGLSTPALDHGGPARSLAFFVGVVPTG